MAHNETRHLFFFRHSYFGSHVTTVRKMEMVDVIMEICCRVDGGVSLRMDSIVIPHCTVSCGNDSTVISHILKSSSKVLQCWIIVLAVSLSCISLGFLF